MTPTPQRRVVITRTPEQAAPWLAALAQLGFNPVALPTLALAPPGDSAALDLALRRAADYDGFIFASANAVRSFFDRAATLDCAPVRPPGSWVAAVGPATAAALPAAWAATVVPAAYSAAGLLAALADTPLTGQRILIPRASIAADTLPAELARRGATVLAVEAYQTVPALDSRPAALALFPAAAPPGTPSPATAVVFSSPSSARFLAQLLGDDYRLRLAAAGLVAIGPATAAALASLGLPVAARAPEATLAGLVRALMEYWHA